MTRTFPRRRMGRRVSGFESLETRRLLAFIVNTTLDETAVNATTSLREAIQFATANSGDDTITFDPAVFDGTLKTITLGSALSYTSGSGKLFINGPGQDELDISGDNLYRVFNVGAAANLVLNDLTVTKGFDAVEGGGIHNLGTLTLNRVTVELSKVTGAVGAPGPVIDSESTTATPIATAGPGGNVRGAGIFNSGTLTATDCLVLDNLATGGLGGLGSPISAGGLGGSASGAGIYTSGEVDLFDTLVQENNATGGAGGNAGYVPGTGGHAQGGGLYAEASTSVEMTESRTSDNLAKGGKGGTNTIGNAAGSGGSAFGGGMYILGTIGIVGQQQGGNTALGGQGGDSGPVGGAGSGGTALGAGAYINGSFGMEETEWAQNNARGGDAGTAIAANVGGSGANGSGGGVYLTNSASGIFDLVTWHQNSAQGGGGGTTGAAFLPGLAGIGQGGALYNLSTDVLMTDNGFQSNNAIGGTSGIAGAGVFAGVPGEARGGTIAHLAASKLTITGGFLIQSLALGGQVFDANNSQTSGAARGGGIYTTIASDLELIDVSIRENTALGGFNLGPGNGGSAHGGAIAADGNVTITDCEFLNNSAEGADSETLGGAAFGGAIECDPGELTITRSTFNQNDATGGRADAPGADAGRGNGGAIYGGGHVAIIDSTIDHNVAEGRAGADATVGGGGDGGEGIGGAMYLESTAKITNSTIYANDATGGDGGDTTANAPGGDGGRARAGGIYSDDTLEFINATVAHNIADSGAAGASTGGGAAGTAGVSDGGGIYSQVAITLVNTIVANNDATSHPDVRQTVNATNSLISDTSGIVFNTDVNNQKNVDPDLGPLQDNDGPTETALPNEGSDAINAGNNAAAIAEFGANGNDQRGPGFPRILGGTVDIGAVETSDTIKINFQPLGAPVPAGFFPDTGSVYGLRLNGLTYGWNLNASSFTRDRNILSDQAKDTLVHTQLYGNRTWEIEVPNGAYEVHLVAGDAQYFNSVYKINVEGVLTVNGTPTSGNRFIEGTQTVVVSDGKLTVTNAAGSSNNKINFIEITPADVVPVKINFQPGASAIPPGYLPDSGQTFANRGNGQSYGWNLSATSFTRDRNSGLSPDQRYDTLIHTQLYGTRSWELAVPNGTYSVKLVAGDPDWFNSVYKFNLEGILALSGTPSSGNRWIEATKIVSVSDGKLTLTNAAGSVNNKIAFIDVTPL